MPVLRILGAGATQRVIGEVLAADDGGFAVDAQFGGVHAIAARIAAGEPADVVVLTADLLDELADAGAIDAASRHDLGRVETGFAVRTGGAVPDTASLPALRSTLLAAASIIYPDPALATAGRAFAQVLEALDLREQLAARLVACANGEAAARRLAAGAPGDLGVMQVTEILAHPALAIAGRFPPPLGRPTLYGAAVPAHAAQPRGAADFIRRLAAARQRLRAAGFSPATARA